MESRTPVPYAVSPQLFQRAGGIGGGSEDIPTRGGGSGGGSRLSNAATKGFGLESGVARPSLADNDDDDDDDNDDDNDNADDNKGAPNDADDSEDDNFFFWPNKLQIYFNMQFRQKVQF